MKKTSKVIACLLAVIMLLSVVPVFSLAVTNSQTKSKGFEIYHWGIPILGSNIIAEGGNYYSNSFNTWNTSALGTVKSGNGTMDDNEAPPQDAGENTVVGWSVVNLIACPEVQVSFDWATVAPNIGDKFTVKYKVDCFGIYDSYNMQNASGFKDSEYVCGAKVSPDTASEVKYFPTAAQFDDLKTYIDPTYGFQYKEIVINTKRKAGMASTLAVYASQPPSFPEFQGYIGCYGIEIYNENGDYLWGINGEDMYNWETNGKGIKLMGTGWGGTWLVACGYEWKKGESGDMYGGYLDDYIFTDLGAGTYALEVAMEITEVENPDDEIVSLGIGLPDGSQALGSVTIKGSDVKPGFSIYTFAVDMDPNKIRSRVEPLIHATGNANIKLSNIAFVKLGGAAAVDAMITAIGTPSVTNIDAIEAARTAYDKLDAEEQSEVSALAILEEAELALADLKAAKPVYDEIAALGTITLSSVIPVTTARGNYDKLTKAQQAYVTNYATLTAAEAKLTLLDLAKNVIAEIEALPAAADVTLDDETAIASARTNFDALEPEVQAVVDITKLTAAENAIEVLKSIVYGDLDGSKTVEAADALLALQGAVKKITLSDVQSIAADVDGNETVEAADALLILQKAVKKISQFPIELDR